MTLDPKAASLAYTTGNDNERRPMSQQAKNAQPAKQPTPAIPAGMVPAWFTEREIFQIRNACRDSDNENAVRFFDAALARAAEAAK